MNRPAKILILVCVIFFPGLSSAELEPVAQGMVPIYLFTGARASSLDNSGLATVVTCTRFTPSADLQVELYDMFGDFEASTTSPGDDNVGRTITFATNQVATLANEIPLSAGDPVEAGLIRVLAEKAAATSTLCIANVVDASTILTAAGYPLSAQSLIKFKTPK
jgi:hypothetical protein